MAYNKEAFDKLTAAEREYLCLNGWEELGPDDWDDPEVHRVISFGHAVNAQKYRDRMFRFGE